MKGEATNEVEIQILNPTWPEPRWCSVNGRPLRDEVGRVCGGVVASRDITDRKRLKTRAGFARACSKRKWKRPSMAFWSLIQKARYCCRTPDSLR